MSINSKEKKNYTGICVNNKIYEMLSCDKNSHQRFSLVVYFFNCQRSVERRAEQHLSNTELITQSGKQEISVLGKEN